MSNIDYKSKSNRFNCAGYGAGMSSAKAALECDILLMRNLSTLAVCL